MGILGKITKKKKPAEKALKPDAKKVTKKTSAKTQDIKSAAKARLEKLGTSVRAYKVLIRPLVTEKSTELASQGKYIFEVARATNKIEVARAVKELYGVDVEQVNMINTRGKVVAFGRNLGKRKDYKKAIVTLKKGQTIQVFEGV